MRTKSLLPLFLISVMALPSMLWGTHAGFTEHAIPNPPDYDPFNGARTPPHAADIDVDRSGKAVASGMYFTVLSDGNKIIVQKMLLLK